MDFFADYKKMSDKLAETLADHNLLHTFKTDTFPITLTVRQNQAPDAQMEIFATTDGSISAQDSVLRLIFKLDEIEIQTDSRFVISEALMNKIKSHAKKLHYTFLQAYFADRRNKERMDLYGDPDAAEGEDDTTEDAEDADEGPVSSFEGFFDVEDTEPTEGEESEDGAEE